ncbi:MAG: DUF3011 domain-containing protein [Bdellovibrionota bacterium]
MKNVTLSLVLRSCLTALTLLAGAVHAESVAFPHTTSSHYDDGRGYDSRYSVSDIYCKSEGMRYNECGAQGRIVEVQLVRQYSRAECRENRSYGYNRDRVWVDQGCEGLFRVTVENERRSVSTARVTCDSRGMRYNECLIGGNTLRVDLIRQTSSADCREGSTYGLVRDGMWVDRGCSGIFEITYER